MKLDTVAAMNSVIKNIFLMIIVNVGIVYGVTISEGPQLPYGVSGHCAGIVGGKVVVAGGSYWNEDKTQKVFLKKSLVFKEGCWIDGLLLPAEVYCGMFAYDDTGLYIVGGRNSQRMSAAFFCIKNNSGNLNVVKFHDFPTDTADGSAAILNSVLYAACPSDSNGATNSFWSINLDSQDNHWIQRTSLPGKARSFPGLNRCGQKIILLGGLVLPGFEVLKDVYAYDPNENKWDKLGDMPSPCYGFGARAISKNKILISGIADQKIGNSIWVLDIHNMTVQNVGNTIIP
jgi:N-acetylneuraminic acid mutarotase